MVVVEWITAVLLLVGIGMSGLMKVTANKMAVENAERLGFTNLMRPLGGAEVLGAIGVLIGAISADLEWLGVLAAVGIIATMVGAVIYHRRAGDEPKEMAPAAVLLVVAVIYIIALFAN